MPRQHGPFQIKKEHMDYLDSIRDELVAAEETVTRIKTSEAFRKAMFYFNTLANRGRLKCRPTKENGYKIVPSELPIILDVEDLTGIVTPEQLEQIKQAAFHKDGYNNTK